MADLMTYDEDIKFERECTIEDRKHFVSGFDLGDGLTYIQKINQRVSDDMSIHPASAVTFGSGILFCLTEYEPGEQTIEYLLSFDGLE